MAKANNFARGIIEKNEKIKTRVSLFLFESGRAQCRAHDTGIHTRRRFNHDAIKMAFKLLRKVGGGASFFCGVSIKVVWRRMCSKRDPELVALRVDRL